MNQNTDSGSNDKDESASPRAVVHRSSTSKKRRSSCPNIEVFASPKSKEQQRSAFIRRVSEMESTPDHSDDSDDDDEDSLFDDTEAHDAKHKNGKVRDVADGIELMLHQLQSEAKQLEQRRYQLFAGGSNSATPNDIVQTIRTRHRSKNRQRGGKGNESMNWWDQPFKDHLRASSRPIVRETGIDQFASEYMLTMLRDQEQSVLRKRQLVEEERTRPPKKLWFESKGQDFNNELRRHKRFHR